MLGGCRSGSFELAMLLWPMCDSPALEKRRSIGFAVQNVQDAAILEVRRLVLVLLDY